MNYTYAPDGWVIVKITGQDPHYRVFGSIGGGYLDSDTWKMNSGITSVKEDDNFYYFEGYSGSVYRCSKKTYDYLTSYNRSVLLHYCTNNDINYFEEMPDIMNMDYIIKRK